MLYTKSTCIKQKKIKVIQADILSIRRMETHKEMQSFDAY
jgi:hypothetical protein